MCFYFFNACLNSFADFKKENKLQRRSDETFKKPQIWDDRIEIEYTKENIINVRIRSSKRKKGAKNFPLGIVYRDTIIINMEVESMRVYAHRTR